MTSRADEIRDWREHFYSVRRRFFAALLSLVTIATPIIEPLDFRALQERAVGWCGAAFYSRNLPPAA